MSDQPQNQIKISKEYKDFAGSIWLGQEITVAPGEDKIEAWRKAEKEMDAYYHSRGKSAPSLHDFNANQPEIVQVEKEVAIGDLETQIRSVTDKKVLDSFKYIVKGKPELEQLYLAKLEELS